jgi:DNA-binding IclR family transcriptional regulator
MDALEPPSPTAGPVGAVASAARILGHLGQAEGPLRLTQISRPLGINTSTCLNILRTLVAEGFVRLDGPTKTYALGRRIVELARGALNRGENLASLRPGMDAIARRYGVTVMLWGRLDPENLILLAASGGEPLRSIHVELGIRVPLLTGSMGRLFARGLEPARIRRLLERVSWQNPPGFDAYLGQVAEAAERGWALDAGNQNAAMWGISAPVAQAEGPLDRALSAVLLNDQRDPEAISRLGHDLAALGRG